MVGASLGLVDIFLKLVITYQQPLGVTKANSGGCQLKQITLYFIDKSRSQNLK